MCKFATITDINDDDYLEVLHNLYKYDKVEYKEAVKLSNKFCDFNMEYEFPEDCFPQIKRDILDNHPDYYYTNLNDFYDNFKESKLDYRYTEDTDSIESYILEYKGKKLIFYYDCGIDQGIDFDIETTNKNLGTQCLNYDYYKINKENSKSELIYKVLELIKIYVEKNKPGYYYDRKVTGDCEISSYYIFAKMNCEQLDLKRKKLCFTICIKHGHPYKLLIKERGIYD